MKIRILLICSSLVFMTSCYKDKEDLLYGTADCQTTSVTYSTDIEPLISGNCAISGCHVQGGTGTGLFENYDQTIAKINDGSFRRRVIVQKDMPPSAPLNECQIQKIEKWLQEGAPNN